ncbi:MAG: hypothetical protein DMD40_05365 [Gemmatimonadetes bacterium]|nr:MAG: hypothetical protein DMD40_05365 [Gemmatimonadota bacterium]
MTSRAFLLPAVLVLLASTVRAQWASRSSAVPLWADSALTKAGFWAGYDFTSRVSPEIAYGDLDGDGLWDIALGIVDKAGRRHGVAIVNQIDRSVHILGAGKPLANGRVEFSDWSLAELLGYRAGVRVLDWHASGWFVWNGQTYVWVQDSE